MKTQNITDLHEKMLNDPLKFDQTDFNTLINSYFQDSKGEFDTEQAFADLRECVRRIYDVNEEQLRETSNANEGLLGKLNRRSTEKRRKRYYKKIENQKPGTEYVRIYAEGDSWFQFPVFVKDIIDWLDENDNFLIYSDAYGGDWITNIIYEGQYIEALTVHSPDVFLLSGGGNDLVGHSRMAVMVTNDEKKASVKYTIEKPVTDVSEEEYDLIMSAQKHITKDFYAYILVMKVQYTLLFKQIYSKESKHKDIISITQGYAYPYPKKGANFSWKYPLQPIINSFLDTGQWLFRPLMIKGILDEHRQRAIVVTFIYEFNKMLMEMAAEFRNVYHIDCRNIPKQQKDWFDELHLKSDKYKLVAELYTKVINEKTRKHLPKVVCLT